ncbi:MAG: TIGR03756 family integrating conjugative element protein [Gammaproteobacteria bacterium]
MIKQLLACLCLIIITSAQAENGQIHSGTIIKDTLAALPNCLHYQIPTHFCIWISESGDINTTPIVSHYLPDLVISVFAKPHDNPWIEVNKILDNIGQPIQKEIVKSVTGIDVGNGNHNLLDQHEQNVIFKEADVIGNPALTMMPAHGLLPSIATPWQPYFQSMSDSLLWRGLPPAALTEEGMALGLNVIHHIGIGLTNWGGVYPHEGKVINDNDTKASAVIAERAGDLVTSRSEYGHVYKYLSTSCGEHCSASPIQENSEEAYFQMIYPTTQTDCHILGNSDSYTPDMLNPERAYVWVVWRHYEGCADGDGQYLGRN